MTSTNLIQIVELFILLQFPSFEAVDFYEGSRLYEFDLVNDSKDHKFRCEAKLFGKHKTNIVINCVNQKSVWPLDVRGFIYKFESDELVDAKEELLSIEHIVDTLDGFMLNESKMKMYLASPVHRAQLLKEINFDLEDDQLLATINDIEGLIEGAQYVSFDWNEEKGLFEPD